MTYAEMLAHQAANAAWRLPAEPRPTARLDLDRDELLLLVESLENRTDDATREEALLVCKLLNAIEDIAHKEDR